MKFLTHLLVVALLFTVKLMNAQQQAITATVVNVLSNEGKVSFALFDEANFMKKPIQAKTVVIKEGKSRVVFENVPAGEYAITCYHDKNNNQRMDFEPSGMPLEAYGASNNVMRFGPPQYDDAKFVVADKDVSLKIKF